LGSLLNSFALRCDFRLLDDKERSYLWKRVGKVALPISERICNAVSHT